MNISVAKLNEIYNIVRSCPREKWNALIAEKKDADYLYALSHIRGNIIRGFVWTGRENVLELGADCGEITEVLCQLAGSVTAVEPVSLKCRIIDSRTIIRDTSAPKSSAPQSAMASFKRKKQEAVFRVVPEIICADLKKEAADLTDAGKKYDVILLNGTFEDSGLKLSDLIKLLSPDGRLLIAAYNRLSFREFAGWADPVTGRYFSGIENYSKEQNLQNKNNTSGQNSISGQNNTSGPYNTQNNISRAKSGSLHSRQEWIDMIESAGTDSGTSLLYEFYYPYPDHRFPMQLFSDSRLPEDGELNINHENIGFKRLELFDDDIALESIRKEGIFKELANSFLICISEKEVKNSRKGFFEPASDADKTESAYTHVYHDVVSRYGRTIYAKFSNERKADLSVTTVMTEEDNGKRHILKFPEQVGEESQTRDILRIYHKLSHLYNGILPVNKCISAVIASDGMTHSIADDAIELEYITGVPYSQLVDEEYQKNGQQAAMDMISDFISLVIPESKLANGSLPVSDLDMIMDNCLVTDDGPVLIDYEWTTDEKIPADYIKYRIIHYFLNGKAERKKQYPDNIYEHFGLAADSLRLYEKMEQSFQKSLTDRVPVRDISREISPDPVSAVFLAEYEYPRVSKENIELGQKNGELNHELYESQKANIDLQNDLKTLREQNEKLSNDIDKLKSENERLISSIIKNGRSMSMKNILYCIDSAELEKKGNKNYYVINGWFADRTGAELSFLVTDENGQQVPYQIAQADRADVIKAKKELSDHGPDIGRGFRIPYDFIESTDSRKIIIYLIRGEERKAVFEKKTADIISDQKNSSLHYNIDAWATDNGVSSITGWAFNENSPLDICVTAANGTEIQAQIDKKKRLDVVMAFALEEDSRPGFIIKIDRSALSGHKIKIHFKAADSEKTVSIDLDRAENERTFGDLFHKLFKKSAWKVAYQYFKMGGMDALKNKIKYKPNDDMNGYLQWFLSHKATNAELKEQRSKEKDFPYRPKISIVVPTYNTPRQYLRDMIESVINQSYANWELCLADGSPDKNNILPVIKEYQQNDSRIKVRSLDENKGISENTNAALELADGDYIALLDHDDELALNALFEIVKVINAHDDAEVIYTDEDKYSDTDESHYGPHFKPDFNLDLLRSNNYICHFFIVKRNVFEAIGGNFRPEFDGSQDYDFIFRCTEKAKAIYHIPQILYYWRSHPNSVAGDPESKAYAYEAGLRAIKAHLDRCGETGATVERQMLPGYYTVTYPVKRDERVSIIIPNKDHIDDLKKCIKSILSKTTYKNYEIVVVENNSTEPETFDFYRRLEKRDNIRVVKYEGDFNYSRINNFAVRQTDSPLILFLNNDTEVIDDDWLDRMTAHCQRPEIGAVGAKLYFPDDTIQHAGVVIGLGGFAGHIMYKQGRNDIGYFARAFSAQDWSAVTAACMMMRRDLFDQIGGFDENLTVAFNDVDLCLKIREKDKLIVMDPAIELYHYESKSRGMDMTGENKERFDKETEYMMNRWKDIYENGDPYYNVNLSLTESDYSLRQ